MLSVQVDEAALNARPPHHRDAVDHDVSCRAADVDVTLPDDVTDQRVTTTSTTAALWTMTPAGAREAPPAVKKASF